VKLELLLKFLALPEHGTLKLNKACVSPVLLVTCALTGACQNSLTMNCVHWVTIVKEVTSEEHPAHQEHLTLTKLWVILRRLNVPIVPPQCTVKSKDS
jgi:hypothetical protein